MVRCVLLITSIHTSGCPHTCSRPRNVHTAVSQNMFGGLNVQTRHVEHESEHGWNNVSNMLQNMSPCRVAEPSHNYSQNKVSRSQMKVLTLCALVTALLRGAEGVLPSHERSYKFLMLLPASSKSHRNILMALSEALADRGHKVGTKYLLKWSNALLLTTRPFLLMSLFFHL